jgi:hypothetical protein
MPYFRIALSAKYSIDWIYADGGATIQEKAPVFILGCSCFYFMC